jgi:hypothetical protein
VAAYFCELVVFQKLLKLAKNNLTRVVNKLLLAADNKGRTVVHLPADLSHLEIFKGILTLA